MSDTVTIEDLLDPGWVPVYQRRLQTLHTDLARTRNKMLVLKEIVLFPWDTFGGLDTFWRTTREALLEAVVSGLWRVTIDDKGGSLTFRRLVDDMRRHTRTDGTKSALDAELRKVDFNRRFKRARELLTTVRGQSVGHLEMAAVDSGSPAPGVNLKVLFDAVDAVIDLLHVVGFRNDLDRTFLVADPHLEPTILAANGMQSAVADLLDSVVRGSRLFRMAEEDPSSFALYWRNKATPQDRDAINQYRRKLGLNELPPP